MNGILILDKPPGMTSHDVVARCRRILKTKKIGHTGTLDPFATGVIVILVGRATRLAQFLDKDEKEYLATLRFGFETETGDLTGQPRAEPGEFEAPTIGQLRSVLPEFLGEQLQTPPMYSAKKIEGKKLYELARKGIEIERKAVPVTIKHLEVTPEFELSVTCSAGTYIRTLAEDIARSAGSRAHLTSLRRTRAGKFSIESAVTLAELEETMAETIPIIGMNEALSHIPAVMLPEPRVEKTRNGMSSRLFGLELEDGETVRMLAPDGELIAVGTYDSAAESVQPKLVLV